MGQKETTENNIETERTKVKTWIQFRKQLLSIGNERLKKHGAENLSVSFQENTLRFDNEYNISTIFSIENSEIRKGLSRCKTIIELAIKASNETIKALHESSKKAPKK